MDTSCVPPKRMVVGVRPQVASGSIDWTIPNFFQFVNHPGHESREIHLTGDFYWSLGTSSRVPERNDEHRRVTFHLNVCKKSRNFQYGAYVHEVSTCFNTPLTVRSLRWKFGVLDNVGKEVYYQGSDDFQKEAMARTQQIAIKDGRGRISVDIPYERIWNPKSDESPLLYQNALNSRVTFEYVHEVSTTYITPTVPEFPRLELEGEMASNFMKLYRTREGADFVVVCTDEKEFAVHRAVLQARSEYFAAMLIPHSKEAASGRCVLPDMNSEMVEVLLLFIYGGLKKVPEELAQPLLIAADKYQFPLLKAYCEALLVSQVMLGTAAHFLVLADTHSAPKLRAACLMMIKEGFVVFREAGGMEKLRAEGNAELLTMVKDMVEPKPS